MSEGHRKEATKTYDHGPPTGYTRFSQSEQSYMEALSESIERFHRLERRLLRRSAQLRTALSLLEAVVPSETWLDEPEGVAWRRAVARLRDRAAGRYTDDPEESLSVDSRQP